MPLSIPSNTLEKFTTFGDLLRYLRRRVGITQMELAELVGYSDAQISRLEQNLRPPDLAIIESRFIPALGIEDELKTVTRLLELAANIRREDAPVLGLCPYKGLNYFDEVDADLFVGRESLTDKLVGKLLALAESPIRFLAIVGASGSGKSSLVRAGLVPALRWSSQSMEWLFHVLTPTANPLESLAAYLIQNAATGSDQAALVDHLANDPHYLHLFFKDHFEARNHFRQLLVVDQFEEVFTACRSVDERASFIGNLLLAAMEPRGSVMVIITLRADFYAHCAEYNQLREALAHNQEYIGAMGTDELRRAIEEPARRGRWDLESGLVELLLHDIGQEPGSLPLLSHALLETWQRRRGRMLTLSGYTSSGGVRGAIAETAEAVFADQFTPEQQAIARRIFLRLTELGDESGAGHTRRRATFNELILKPEEAAMTRAVLKALADARLITTSENAAEVAHEALIREWPTLQNWLEENRTWLNMHRQLTEAAQEWANLHREPDLLYRGARLSQVLEFATAHKDELNVLERDFLNASVEAREMDAQQREAQRQRELAAAQELAQVQQQRAEEQSRSAAQLRKRAYYLTGAFVAALIMAVAALFFGSQARQTAEIAQNERRVAQARELAAAALNNIPVDPERSILLAMKSVATTRDIDGTVLPEAEEALHHSIVASPIRMTLQGHETGVLSAAFSLDGKQLATIGADGTIIFWDASNGDEISRIPGTNEPGDLVTAQRIIYSPDGKLLAACANLQVIVLDPRSGELLATLAGSDTELTAVAFSRDGKYISAGNLEGTVYIWDTERNSLLLELAGHTDAIEGLAFSPDGKWLVTAGSDATMKIWEVASGSLLENYSGFAGVVDSVAFSPDGTQFALSSSGIYLWQLEPNAQSDVTMIGYQENPMVPEGAFVAFHPDGTRVAAASASAVKLWDAGSGRQLLNLVGHTDWVMGLAFSPDGTRLASTSLDKTVKVWYLGLGFEVVTVLGRGAGYGNRVAYHPSRQEFALNGGDGTTTLWDAESGKRQLALSGHEKEVLSIAYSSDGERFVTGGLDGNAIVWDVASGAKLLTLAGHQFGVRDIAFSPDGSRIATGGFDGSGKLWDASTGEQLLTITEHAGLVVGVAFSPDGKRLATSSTDATAKIWDTGSGRLLFTLTGHDGSIPDIAFSPDGQKLATGGKDTTVRIWEAASGKELLNLTGHSAEVQSVVFSPDGKLIASGSGDNTAKVWKVETGEEILTLPGNSGGVYGVAFSVWDGGGHLAVASNDGIVRLYMLAIDPLLALARTRVTRSLTEAECREYLHLDSCP